MKKRPEGAGVAAVAAAAALALASGAFGQEFPEKALADWYRVELLVFLREDDESLGAERWKPLPELAYPGDARFLLDPELADRRLAESGAYASTFDGAGIQQLLLPAAFSPLDVPGRPDSLIREPYREPVAADPEAKTGSSDAIDEEAGSDGSPGPGAGAQPGSDATEDPVQASNRIALARPYQLLRDDVLEFRAEARSLRRSGRRVAFHGAWWMRLPPDRPMPALLLDRGADPDNASWPDLQGSVRIDRSRYLHIDVDLWLNTLATYLPEGWQIDAPPLPPASIAGQTLAGTERNPWAPEPVLPALSDGAESATTAPSVIEAARTATRESEAAGALSQEAPADRSDDAATTTDGAQAARPYPWHHAIVHRQSRRMRSGEVHYLDHPVIGVVVKLVPAGDEWLPISGEDDLVFSERHGLPVEYVEYEQQ